MDAAFLSAAQRKVDHVASCAGLNDAAKLLPELQALEASIADRLAELQPLLALLNPPAANPVAIVTWITSLVSGLLEPMVRPIATYAAQAAALTATIGQLVSDIEARAGAIEDCIVELTS